MKRLITLLLLAVCTWSVSQAQTDWRTRETKIADIVMLLPAGDAATFNRLMGELLQLGDVIADLASKLSEQGGSDGQIRYAVSGLAMYASKDANLKHSLAQSFCAAITKAKSDGIREFLFDQLQYVAGDESVETAARYLENDRLADAAARVLVRVGSDAAGNALTEALIKAGTPLRDAKHGTLVKALGDMRYRPAAGVIGALATDSHECRKVMLHSLAQIADPSSEMLLSQYAAAAGYQYELTDALGSYLLFLKNSLYTDPIVDLIMVTPLILSSDGGKDMVANAAGKMLKATSETSQLAAKSAALELLILSTGKKAVGHVVDALKSDNKQYRMAALKYAENSYSAKMFDALMKVAKKEKRSEVKAEVLAAFGERSDVAAWPFVKENLTDDNATVRMAAIEAAGKIAGADAIAPVVNAMNVADERIVAAGKHVLLAIDDQQVVADVAAALPQAPTPAKIAFLEILGSRHAASQAETIFAQATSTDEGVRKAAVKALASVVTEKDVPRIAQLLNAASPRDEIAALQRTLFAATSAINEDELPDRVERQLKQTNLVAEQATLSRNPGIYGNVLAMIGGEKALDLVINYGFNSGGAILKDAAFEALLNWSDGLAIPKLYEIAVGDPAGPYFDKALSAYINKTGASNETPEQKLIMLRNALKIATTQAQKQSILQQIGRTGTFIGLMTAGKYLDDPNQRVQQAAVQAVQTIALAHPAYYGTEITALLNKAMAVNKDAEADYQRQAVQKHLAALPQDDGFVSMFNGRDLTGWKGLVENPIARARMKPTELAKKQAIADEVMRNNWKVVDGLLVYEGKGYDNLCSARDYADIEMYVDWRITAKGDAGIYLRGSPQVQIWDVNNRNAHVGSGGLYNNQKHPANPLVVADNPVDEWNSFYIKMVGEKVIVYLNGQLVVDNITLENYWDRQLPIFEKDAIELQAHGDRVEYRDLYVREIARADPYLVSDEEKADGFVPIFNGIDMSGWVGNLRDYVALDGAIVCDPSKGGNGGNLYTDKDYADFVLRFEFMLTPAANNGIAIRAPFKADASYSGMEIQVLDNEADVYRDLQPYQYHGSVYGVIPAQRGYLKPLGEWNVQEIIADGNHIKVTLNGTVILDGDLAVASKNFTETMDKRNHPELKVKSGRLGFLGHGSWVAFRHLRVKEL